jgi:hypothetical protein
MTIPESASEEGGQARPYTQWHDRSAEVLKQGRQRRLAQLRSRRTAVQRAQEAYRAIDLDLRPSFGIRSGFIRLEEPRPDVPEPDEIGEDDPSVRARILLAQDLDSRPPMTKLLHRKTNALTLFLTAIYIAQLESGPGETFVNIHRNHTIYRGAKPWATLAGLHLDRKTDSRNRRVRITRALEELRKVELVEVGPARKRGRFEGFSVNCEDGTLKPYTPPGANVPFLVHLPASFFLNCWHIVLEPNELALLLAVIDLTQRTNSRLRYGGGQLSVALPRSVRWKYYGISGEAYASVHELAEFGLVEFHDEMPGRSRGKFKPLSQGDDAEVLGVSQYPEPYRFVYERDGMVFNRDAYQVVTGALQNRPYPPRLSA